MIPSSPASPTYHRYHIPTRDAPDRVPWPSRFRVRVSRPGLLWYMIREFIAYRGDMGVILSRPCMYGVFSRVIGGMAPVQQKCVGCLRCVTQHFDFVRIEHNPARKRLGDSYFTSQYVDAVIYEAETGRVPVKGAGYRGQFGGAGWDGIWTDMSEIVRPTRDGIHGREFISTVVDIGRKPGFLSFDASGQLQGALPETFSIPLPMLFDAPAPAVASDRLCRILAQAAADLETLVILPLATVVRLNLSGAHIVPLVTPAEADRTGSLPDAPLLIEMDGWDPPLYQALRQRFPQARLGLRLSFTSGADLLRYVTAGVSVFHFTADYHGCGPGGTFVFDHIRVAHTTLVEARLRDQVTLLGSGGIVAAEHVPKAIIGGLDAVALDTPPLVALQAQLSGDFTNRQSAACTLPKNLAAEWGVQRIKNLMAAWRDQLLEVLGAMGLREVRRLRGEMGRALLQDDLEREAFAGIEGYHG